MTGLSLPAADAPEAAEPEKEESADGGNATAEEGGEAADGEEEAEDDTNSTANATKYNVDDETSKEIAANESSKPAGSLAHDKPGNTTEKDVTTRNGTHTKVDVPKDSTTEAEEAANGTAGGKGADAEEDEAEEEKEEKAEEKKDSKKEKEGEKGGKNAAHHNKDSHKKADHGTKIVNKTTGVVTKLEAPEPNSPAGMLKTVNATLPGKEHSVDRIMPDFKRPPKHVPKAHKEHIIRGGKDAWTDSKGKKHKHVSAKHIKA